MYCRRCAGERVGLAGVGDTNAASRSPSLATATLHTCTPHRNHFIFFSVLFKTSLHLPGGYQDLGSSIYILTACRFRWGVHITISFHVSTFCYLPLSAAGALSSDSRIPESIECMPPLLELSLPGQLFRCAQNPLRKNNTAFREGKLRKD